MLFHTSVIRHPKSHLLAYSTCKTNLCASCHIDIIKGKVMNKENGRILSAGLALVLMLSITGCDKLGQTDLQRKELELKEKELTLKAQELEQSKAETQQNIAQSSQNGSQPAVSPNPVTPFVGERFFDFNGGTGTGMSIKIANDGKTTIKTYGANGSAGIIYKGMYKEIIPVGGMFLKFDKKNAYMTNKLGKLMRDCMDFSGDNKACISPLEN